MKLTDRRLELMREAGIHIEDVKGYTYSADDEDRLANLLIDSLAPGQNMTPKAYEIQALLNYLADWPGGGERGDTGR